MHPVTRRAAGALAALGMIAATLVPPPAASAQSLVFKFPNLQVTSADYFYGRPYGVWFGPSGPYVKFVVKNTGGAAAGASTASVKESGGTLKTFAVPPLAPGASVTHYVGAPVTLHAGCADYLVPAGHGWYTIVADSAGAVTELPETDNAVGWAWGCIG
jgi:hypothetical protein